MPVMKAEQIMRIPKIHLDVDSQGLFLDLNCPHASAYVLCFSKGTPIERSELQLAEDDLRALYHGCTLKMQTFRLQGVPRRVFHAMPVFRHFQVHPPEQIQIWTMSYNSYDDLATLHMPENSRDQLCYAPMRYKYRVRTDGDISYLKVDLLDEGQYDSGALAYQVDDALPIPIPESAFGREFPVRTGRQKYMHVIVTQEYTGKYTLDRQR